MSEDTTSQRLNKYLALQLGISRREADNLIERGSIAINGQSAILGARIQPDDKITLNGKPLTSDAKLIYVALNKPVGYVCSRKRQGDSPTIYELLPQEFHTLKPVGRLDRNSSGIILLTNDGDFAYRMTHPKFRKTKTYQVRLDRDLEPLHQQMISDYGINLDDGISQLHLERLDDDHRREWRITMSEGRNRQIRRTFVALGYEIQDLHRTDFGPYSVNDVGSDTYKLVDLR